MTRTVTARNSNASLLLVARVLNSATMMWTTVWTRILRRRTGGGGYQKSDKVIKSAAGNDFDDEDVVKGGLAEKIWKREQPLPSIAGVAGKDGESHYPPSLFSSSNTIN
jgi:hypothetical protein